MGSESASWAPVLLPPHVSWPRWGSEGLPCLCVPRGCCWECLSVRRGGVISRDPGRCGARVTGRWWRTPGHGAAASLPGCPDLRPGSCVAPGATQHLSPVLEAVARGSGVGRPASPWKLGRSPRRFSAGDGSLTSASPLRALPTHLSALSPCVCLSTCPLLRRTPAIRGEAPPNPRVTLS